MVIIRPRLNDFHNLPFRQEDVDFVIPYIDEDIPLYIDPFLMYKSPSQQDTALHIFLISAFNHLGQLYIKGDDSSIETLIECSECNEVGLGNSKSRNGKKISRKTAEDILNIFKTIPHINANGISHIEEIQLLIENIGEDRICDLAANFIKSFLIDFTIDQCDRYNIPVEVVEISCMNDKTYKFEKEIIKLPVNPNTKSPIILVPKRWLRRSTFINFHNYSNEYYTPKVLKTGEKPDRIKILNYNRQNYDMIINYIKLRERQQTDCQNDPLFKPIPVLSIKRKLDSILKLPTGKTNNADIEYENHLCPLLATLLYPHLDFACSQSRTASGVSIRDLIFYNNNSEEFLQNIYKEFNSTQLIFELKNVNEVNNDHVDQVNRYLKDSLGNFGVIFTRNKAPQKVIRNTVDLWSSQRKCILIMTDEDLKLMCKVFESKNRTPIEVFKMKYIEFKRLIP